MEDKDPAYPTDRETHGIGWAVKQMHNGERVGRKGWNGKGMYLYLVLPNEVGTDRDMTLPFVCMKTADDNLVPWLCSQTDLLATDWEIV